MPELPLIRAPGMPGKLEPMLLERMLEEQRQRWQQGELLRVEACLMQQPALREDPEAVLQLVFGEVLLREQTGETPSLQEFQNRFPELAAQLKLQFAMDRA